MKITARKKSLLTGLNTLEPLYTLKSFPVFIGCTSEDKKKDLRADMVFDICKNTGFIQLRNLLPLEVIYGQYHSEAVGGVWKEHHQKFSEFIAQYKPQSVLEVGGSNGNLAKITIAQMPSLDWTIIEPAPTIVSEGKIKVIKGYFDGKFKFKNPVDAVINSHVLEHLYDPESMIRHIYKILPSNGKFIFSVPHLYKWLANHFPNTLNFEHTVFLTEDIVDYLLKRNGFKILSKDYFQEHSIFYCAQKTNNKLSPIPPRKYDEYKKLYLGLIAYYKKEVSKLNRQVEKINGPVYLFGAHIFSQFLLYFGLNEKKLAGILDNSELKQGKRLYGSALKVSSPKIITGQTETGIILRAGAYNAEIKRQLIGLNNKVVIL